MIKDKNGGPFCKIFVHFRYWPNDENANKIRQRLIDGDMVKIVYDTPWFWKCSASRVPKPEREKTKKPAYVDYSDKKEEKPERRTLDDMQPDVTVHEDESDA